MVVLLAIISWSVQRGGLAKAAKVDAARKAERDKRDKRERGESERVRNMSPGHIAVDDSGLDVLDAGAALISLLFSLFD